VPPLATVGSPATLVAEPATLVAESAGQRQPAVAAQVLVVNMSTNQSYVVKTFLVVKTFIRQGV
jgi:hypothetical protein